MYPHTPATFLNHTLFVLNFLNVDSQGQSTAERLWNPTKAAFPEVKWKDPLTGIWRGPNPVLLWGHGCVCVFPRSADSPCWIPERLYGIMYPTSEETLVSRIKRLCVTPAVPMGCTAQNTRRQNPPTWGHLKRLIAEGDALA